MDALTPANPATLAIIGGGWSGTALAIHLLHAARGPIEIVLFESAPQVGRGVAYRTPQAIHRLNVPARSMSIFPEEPDDFVCFAQAHEASVGPDDLLGRKFYASYIDHALQRALSASQAHLHVVSARVHAVQRSDEGDLWQIVTHDGRHVYARHAILATGHGEMNVPAAFTGWEHDARLTLDPTEPHALDGLCATGPLVIVGTGLTAVDVLLSLHTQGFAGPIHAISRHGDWPKPHLAQVGWQGQAFTLSPPPTHPTVATLQAWIEAEIARAWQARIPWQAVLSRVQTHVPALWASLDEHERSVFLTTVRSRWEVHRHRVPHDTHAQIADWHASGWLTTHAGGVQAVCAREDGSLEVEAAQGALCVRARHVILATGHRADVRDSRDPLWQQLQADHLVTSDPHGLGITTDAAGRALDADGAPTGLWALGGLLRPYFFESTSVPSLAPQAAALASRLLAEI